MSKPLFFTGRKELLRSDVQIRVAERPNHAPRFEPYIDLSAYTLPPEARVVVEAYHNAYWQRFCMGTVDHLDAGRTYELSNLAPGDTCHFRVKVIAEDTEHAGCLLAAIDEVRPYADNDESRDSILPLVAKGREEMGNEFWRVHFVEAGDEVQPELWINRDAEGLFAAIQSQEPKTIGLVMPAVLREVLLVLTEDAEAWTEDGTLGTWLRFAKQLCGEEFPACDSENPDESRKTRREWVDAVVKQFAARHDFLASHNAPTQPEPNEVSDD